MSYFPLFVDLSEKKCLVVGGGNVAARKVKVLLDFDAIVDVVSDNICQELEELSEMVDNLSLIHGQFREELLADFYLAVAATDDSDLNSKIATLCKKKNILVNVVDNVEECTFIFPSYIKKQQIVAAFSSGGNAPVVSKYLKKQASELVTDQLGQINEWMGGLRDSIKGKLPTEALRKEAFNAIFEFALTKNDIPTQEETEAIISQIKRNEL